MVDSRITKFAKVLTHYSLNLKKGELVFIEGNALSEALLLEVYKEALALGANPGITTRLESQQEMLLKYGNNEQISFVNPAEKAVMENSDALLTIMGGSNNKALTNIDPQKLRIRSMGRKDIQNLS